MAERLDVAGRLAEGQPAVEHTQTYVRACQVLGYHDPELTSRPNQISDWYDSERDLDLRVLDGDCAQLRAAAGAAGEALRMQRAQVDELAAAWTGPGSESALAFLQRHCDAANALATEIRAAAQRCESLRDNLWHLVDVKVATATAIDDRTEANRPAWLAAAFAVGDRKADELVEHQIKPYVDNDIRVEWLTAMRSARAGVATSYDMVIDKFAAAAPVYFEIPEELLAGRAPFQPAPASAALAPAAALPALVPDPAPAGASTPAAPVAASAPPLPVTAASPSSPDLGAGLGEGSALPAGLGSTAGLDGLGGLGGLGALANRIVDEMSGLLDSAGDQPKDPSGLDDATDTDDTDDDRESDVAPGKPDESETVAAQEATPGDAPPPAGGPPPIDAPPPAATPPVDPPVPPPDAKTPCDIAADELPKAGQ